MTASSGDFGTSMASSMRRWWPLSTIEQGAPFFRNLATSSIGFWVADRPMRCSGRPQTWSSRSSESARWAPRRDCTTAWISSTRSEEHTSELQSPCNLVCRLLLEKKKKKTQATMKQHYSEDTMERQLMHVE